MAAITRLSLDGYGARRTGSFAGKTSTAAATATAGGYDYKTPRVKRRRLYVNGKLHMVTPSEELALVNRLIDELNKQLEQVKPVKAKKGSVSIAAKKVEKLEAKLDEQKVYRALLKEQVDARAARARELAEARRRTLMARIRQREAEDEEDLMMLLAYL